jgi:glycosidase
MPEVNLANPAARDWMIENARFWLRTFDVDGFRLDYANGPGPSFWAHFNRACKAVKADCYCFGEVIDAPDQIGGYIGRLDGVLDFQLNDELRKTFGWQSQSRADYDRFITAHLQHFPRDFVMPAFIDNHDMNRFMTIANNDRSALLAALAALLELPNPPVIYYGTEIGLTQIDDGQEGLHLSRVPMRWDEPQDIELLNRVRGLIMQRSARGLEKS